MKSSPVKKKSIAKVRPIEISNNTFISTPTAELIAAVHSIAEAARVNAEALVLAAKYLESPKNPAISIVGNEITP